jgi:hypothetical protein
LLLPVVGLVDSVSGVAAHKSGAGLLFELDVEKADRLPGFDDPLMGDVWRNIEYVAWTGGIRLPADD